MTFSLETFLHPLKKVWFVIISEKYRKLINVWQRFVSMRLTHRMVRPSRAKIPSSSKLSNELLVGLLLARLSFFFCFISSSALSSPSSSTTMFSISLVNILLLCCTVFLGFLKSDISDVSMLALRESTLSAVCLRSRDLKYPCLKQKQITKNYDWSLQFCGDQFRN